MRHIMPVLAAATLGMWILGEQWLRSKVRQPAWRLP
jgi:hypothetical protein